MKVSDLMTTSPITVGPETPVLDARQLMIDKRFRHVLITVGPKLLGIVTDRDIRLNLPSPANEKKLQLCMSFLVPSLSSPM